MKNLNFGLKLNPELEKINAFSDLNKKTEKYKPLISDLIDTAYSIQNNNSYSNKDLKALEKGLYENSLLVSFYYSGRFLCQISQENRAVQDLLIQLAGHKNFRIRLNNIINMLWHPGSYVVDIVIRHGLNDKSSTVRSKTADIIGRLELKKYKDILPEYILREEKEKVKMELEHCLYWLGHDYKIEEKTKHGYPILVKIGNQMLGRTISEDQFKNLENTLEDIKNYAMKIGRRRA